MYGKVSHLLCLAELSRNSKEEEKKNIIRYFPQQHCLDPFGNGARVYNTHIDRVSLSVKRVSCRLSTRFTEEAKYRFGFDKELVKREKHSFSLSDLTQVAAFQTNFFSHTLYIH